MLFYDYQTVYGMTKRAAKARGNHKFPDSDEFYNNLLRLRGQGFARHFTGERMVAKLVEGNVRASLIAERTWYATGQPYYKIYPNMAAMMAEISIEIPTHVLRLPYPAFTIHLPDDPSNTLQEPGGPRLKSILLFQMNVDTDPDDSTGCRFKFNDTDRIQLASGADRALYINYLFDGEYKGEPLAFNYTLSLRKKEGTIEDFFQKSWATSTEKMRHHPDEYVPSFEMVRRVLNVTIATCFFGIDQHEVVLPDMPRKKLERKIRSAGNASDAINDIRDARKHTKKWTIGREISLPLPLTNTVDAPSDEGKKQWGHASLRRGHMRWQAVGEKRSGRKLIFVHPHMCRPDLPLRPAHGYKIPDQK